MIKAAIFDLDGTVLNNEHAFGEAFQFMLTELGAKNLPVLPQIRGIGLGANWEILLKRYNLETNKSTEELEQWTVDEYFKHFEDVSLADGFEDFITSLLENKIRTALATSSPMVLVKKAIEKFSLNRYFDEIVTADDVSKTKPDPEIFLVAAEKLKVPRSFCVVFEDAQAGIEAARKAGMKVVGVETEDREDKLKDVDMKIVNFTKISLADLQEKFE